MSLLDDLRAALHRRKHNRERQRRLHHGRRARREGHAIRRLRRRIRRALAPRKMYDSIDVAQLPRLSRAVAGYVGGRWPTYALLHKRFPTAKRVSIAVASRYDAEALDVEPGDATPDDVVAWVRRQHKRGVKRPIVYASASVMPAIILKLAKAGIQRKHVRIWTAHYGAGKHRCGPKTCGYLDHATADATQWTDHSKGRNLDESVLAPDFFERR